VRPTKKRRRLPVAFEGLQIIGGLLLAAAASAWIGWEPVAVPFAALALFSAWFFRNPRRTAPQKEGLAISPADGKIIEIREVHEDRYLRDKAVKISIFMNVFDVHVNRIPEAGRISKIDYHPGKFFSANLDKASVENERNTILMETDSGKKILVVQIAGLIARRIMYWVREWEKVSRGERFGLIRFGSRVEIFLPVGSRIEVKVGDRVKSGESVLGMIG
jgi:phosphatidylserine decarboxylase